MKSLFTSDREFQFWDYCVTHNQLLIRSPRFNGKYEFNIDIVFMGVLAIHSISGFFGLTLLELIEEEKFAALSTFFFGDEVRVFALQSGSSHSLVYAQHVNITESFSDFSVTPLKGMGKPEVA